MNACGAILLIAVAMFATFRFLHVSIKTGMMGYMFLVFGTPLMALALVAWAVAARKLSDRPRRLALIVIVLLAAGGWTLVRTEGFSGYIDHEFALRWTPTAEERLLAQAQTMNPPPPPAAASAVGRHSRGDGSTGNRGDSRSRRAGSCPRRQPSPKR